LQKNKIMKIVQSFFLSIIICSLLIACNKNEKLLVKKWRYEKLESKANDEQVAEAKKMLANAPDSLKPEMERKLKEHESLMGGEIFKKSTLDLKADGNFESNNLGAISKGKWSMNKEKTILILNTEIAEGQNMIDSLKIISLDEQNLKYKIFRDQDATLSLVPF
jgi:hypothetical protein